MFRSSDMSTGKLYYSDLKRRPIVVAERDQQASPSKRPKYAHKSDESYYEIFSGDSFTESDEEEPEEPGGGVVLNPGEKDDSYIDRILTTLPSFKNKPIQETINYLEDQVKYLSHYRDGL